MFDFLNRTKWYSRNRQYHRSSLLGFPMVYSIWRTKKRNKQNSRRPVSPWHFYKEAVGRNEALFRKVITCFILVPGTSLLLASQVQVNCVAQTSQVYQIFLQVSWVNWSSSCGPLQIPFHPGSYNAFSLSQDFWKFWWDKWASPDKRKTKQTLLLSALQKRKINKWKDLLQQHHSNFIWNLFFVDSFSFPFFSKKMCHSFFLPSQKRNVPQSICENQCAPWLRVLPPICGLFRTLQYI